MEQVRRRRARGDKMTLGEWSGLLVPDTDLCPVSLKPHVLCLSGLLSPAVSPALSVCCPNIARLATFFFWLGLLNFPSSGHFLTGSHACSARVFCLAYSVDSVGKLQDVAWPGQE